jgi:thiamine-monophosphate kinase
MTISGEELNTAGRSTAEIMIKSELELLDSIRKKVNAAQKLPENIHGIGDDCAVYRISDGRFGLFSTDISIENVHFDLGYASLSDTGYRAMAANISDIYSMGGKPLLALVSIGIPSRLSENEISQLYDGMILCSQKYGVFIAGGDTSRSEKLVVNIAIYGEAASPVYRNGARPGNRIYLTGCTGLSGLGLEILRNNTEINRYPASAEKHLRPEPRGDIINAVLEHYSPTAMIDISDGLLNDLGHICRESGAGFELFTDSLPVHDELKEYCRISGRKQEDYLLYSGEECELIFTSEKNISGIPGISYIGNITPGGHILVSGDSRTQVTVKGYDHFKNTEGNR